MSGGIEYCVPLFEGLAGQGLHLAQLVGDPAASGTVAPPSANDDSRGIDVSDGLSIDLAHIVEESNCGAVVATGDIPIHPDAVQLASEILSFYGPRTLP